MIVEDALASLTETPFHSAMVHGAFPILEWLQILVVRVPSLANRSLADAAAAADSVPPLELLLPHHKFSQGVLIALVLIV
jgi:hypothetical protein